MKIQIHLTEWLLSWYLGKVPWQLFLTIQQYLFSACMSVVNLLHIMRYTGKAKHQKLYPKALRPINRSTKLQTKRLIINLPNVRCAFSSFTRQRLHAKTLMKAGNVFGSPPVRVCIIFCANSMLLYHMVRSATFLGDIQSQLWSLFFLINMNNISKKRSLY